MTTQPSPFLELVIRNARLVQGHPMHAEQRKKDNVLVFQADGITPSMERYFAVAVAKGPEAAQGPDGWKATDWGQQIAARALQDWPNGEYQMPTFAWKIEDGDSLIPNQNGKKNAEREGFPGHWIIKGTTGLVVKTWDGSNPAGDMIEILDQNAVKTGDYCDVAYQIVGNNATQSKGMYLNPTHFVFTRAGASIASSVGSSASDLFGRGTSGISPTAASAVPPAAVPPAAVPPAAVPPAAVPPAAVPPAAVPPVAPHAGFLDADPIHLVDGQQHKASALKAAGWTDAQIQATPRA